MPDLPDNLPIQAQQNPLAPNTSGGLTPAHSILLRYRDLGIMATVMLESGWTPEFEFREILALAQNSESPKLKLAAIKYLREIRDQALQSAGQVAQVSRTVLNSDGSVTRLSAEVVAGNLPQIPSYLNDNQQPQQPQQQPPVLQEIQNEQEQIYRPEDGRGTQTETGTAPENNPCPDDLGDPIPSSPDPTGCGNDSGDFSSAGSTESLPKSGAGENDVFSRGPTAAVVHRPSVNFAHRNPVIISSGNSKPRG